MLIYYWLGHGLTVQSQASSCTFLSLCPVLKNQRTSHWWPDFPSSTNILGLNEFKSTLWDRGGWTSQGQLERQWREGIQSIPKSLWSQIIAIRKHSLQLLRSATTSISGPISLQDRTMCAVCLNKTFCWCATVKTDEEQCPTPTVGRPRPSQSSQSPFSLVCRW